MRASPLSLLVPAATAIALGLTACGSDGDSETVTVQSPSAQAAPATTTDGPSADKAADKRLATAAQLRITDLPSGWEEADADDDEDDIESPCESIRAARSGTTARDSSPDFSNDDAEITSTAYVYPDEATATRFYESLTTAESRRCLADALSDGVKENVKDEDDVEVSDGKSSVVNSAPLGDDSKVVRVKLTATQSGFDQEVNITVGFTRIGRAISLLNTAQLDDDILETSLTTAARRLKDAVSE